MSSAAPTPVIPNTANAVMSSSGRPKLSPSASSAAVMRESVALEKRHRQKIREREQHDHDGRALLDELVAADRQEKPCQQRRSPTAHQRCAQMFDLAANSSAMPPTMPDIWQSVPRYIDEPQPEHPRHSKARAGQPVQRFEAADALGERVAAQLDLHEHLDEAAEDDEPEQHEADLRSEPRRRDELTRPDDVRGQDEAGADGLEDSPRRRRRGADCGIGRRDHEGRLITAGNGSFRQLDAAASVVRAHSLTVSPYVAGKSRTPLFAISGQKTAGPVLAEQEAWPYSAPRSCGSACVCSRRRQPPRKSIEDDDSALQLEQPTFRLINLPTNLRLPRFKSNFDLTHRFNLNLREGSFGELAENLFGLDNGATIGFEYRFAPIRRLQTSYLSGQRRQNHPAVREVRRLASARIDARVGVGPRVGRGRGQLSRSVTRRHWAPSSGARSGTAPSAYATPMWVHNTAALLGEDRDTFFVGVGGRFRIRPTVYVVGEMAPRVDGFTPNTTAYGFAHREARRRAPVPTEFQQRPRDRRSRRSRAAGNPGQLYMGFNISRKFF